MSLSGNTEKITELLSKINALPEAGSGGGSGGGGLEYEDVQAYTCTVDAVSGASYGFAQNSAGYWESGNKGVKSSYALCRVNFNVQATCDIVFDVINYGETNYDYGLMGLVDVALAKSESADGSVHKSFKGKQSASVVQVTYNNVPAGSHFIDVKFIKDSSTNSNNDSIQFKVQAAPTVRVFTEESMAMLLDADSDFVSENIRSGVNIFGVDGTLDVGGFPNGTEWTAIAGTSGNAGYSIVYINGLWVACINGISYSVDGKTWTQSNVTTRITRISYANGIWVACSDSSSTSGFSGLLYSVDGKTWSRSNVSGTTAFKVAYGNGVWVACIGYSKKGLMYSIDGKTWTYSNITSGYSNALGFGAGLFVAESEKGLVYSQDGKTWTQSNITTVTNFYVIEYANDLWVAGGISGQGLYYSVDGKTWTHSNITDKDIKCAYYADGLWVAGGYSQTDILYYSTDGKTWLTGLSLSGNASIECIRKSNGIWLASSRTMSSQGVFYSFDGKTWTHISNEDYGFYAMTNGNGLWVAVSPTGAFYSVTWEPR